MTGETEFVRLAVAVAGTAIATYYDLTHNRNVPDWLSFGMLGAGIVAAAAGLWGAGVADAVTVALPAVVVLALGYLLYRAGQIGGADIVILAAIALLMPAAPKGILGRAAPAELLVQVPFVFSLFLVSGILFGVATLARFFTPCMHAAFAGEVRLATEQKIYLVLLAVTGAVFMWFARTNALPAQFVLIFLAALAFSAFFYVFKSFIARRFLIRLVSVKEIDDEDVLAVEEMEPELVKKYGLKKLLTRKEIARLAKLPIKKFQVYKNMPAFLPYVFAALLLSIIFGDVLVLVLSRAVIGG